MSLRSESILDAKLIMRDGLLRTNPKAVMDERGYVSSWRFNLLPGVDPSLIEPDLRHGRGSELDLKFRAAHSSAALAVNVFGPFRDGATPFPLPGVGEVNLEQFERTYPTGVPGRIPPHLDASARGTRGVVAIESKCLEYFTPKAAVFSPEYQLLEKFRETPWFAEMGRLRDSPHDYRALDAAQLVKHAFGLMNSEGRGATLVYLFWEPDDAESHKLFALHREEVASFEVRTRNGGLPFIALSYAELWKAWDCSGSDRLREHAARLRLRYGGRLGSYEGYTRANGRKTDRGFFAE